MLLFVNSLWATQESHSVAEPDTDLALHTCRGIKGYLAGWGSDTLSV